MSEGARENAPAYDILAAGGLVGGINPYAYVDNNPLSFIDPDGLAPKKYTKPENPNKRKGADDRKPSGERERNVKHPEGEEHSIKPKGGIRPRFGLPPIPNPCIFMPELCHDELLPPIPTDASYSDDRSSGQCGM